METSQVDGIVYPPSKRFLQEDRPCTDLANKIRTKAIGAGHH